MRSGPVGGFFVFGAPEPGQLRRRGLYGRAGPVFPALRPNLVEYGSQDRVLWEFPGILASKLDFCGNLGPPN